MDVKEIHPEGTGERKRMKKLIIGLMLVMLLLASVSCTKPTTTAPSTTSEPASASPPTVPPQLPLNIEAIPSQTAYLPGKPVRVTFSYTNAISESITLSLFPPEIQIISYRPDEIVRSFAAGTQEMELGPSEVVTHILAWDQRNDRGEQVAPGWYYVDTKDITVTKATPPGTIHMEICSITKVLIQFTQGAMEKSIDVNKSQTVGGFTITLERVELSTEGASFYAFAIPPGYSPPQPHEPVLMFDAHAEYAVDGVTRDAGYSAVEPEDDGLRLTWGYEPAYLAPIPNDARELTFTITRLGDWEGPWEFHVSIE